MARICIVTPGCLSSNPRVVKEADAASEAGHDVLVISTRTLSMLDQSDEEILARARWRSIRLDFRSRLRRLPGWLSQRVWRMIFRFSGQGAPQAHSPYCGALRRAARTSPADLYIAHYVAALPAVRMAARRHRRLYAFDAEDFHLGDLPAAPQHRIDRALIQDIEAALSACSHITAASPGIADAYAATYGVARPEVVLNVFPRSQAPAARCEVGRAAPHPTLYWFSQTIGPDRGLECAVEAIAHAKSGPHLHLRGHLHPSYAKTLRDIAAAFEVSERVHFHPLASSLKMEQLAQPYDLGLAAETRGTRNHNIALSNKLFTYLLAGLPVLMSDTDAHRDFARTAEGAAYLYEMGSPQSLAAAMDALLSNEEVLAAAGRRAFALGQTRFNWEHEKGTLLACIERSLERASP